jgi:hypothetical protein
VAASKLRDTTGITRDSVSEELTYTENMKNMLFWREAEDTVPL